MDYSVIAASVVGFFGHHLRVGGHALGSQGKIIALWAG